MRKDSRFILGVTTLITAAVVGGGYYMAQQSREQARENAPGGWQEIQPGPASPAATGNPSKRVSAETPPGRTGTPIKCQDPELGEYWTNASRCEDADLHNRMSIAQPMPTTPARDQYEGRNYKTPQDAAGNSRTNPKPNLRLHAKGPPQGLNVACRFAVGKALEIERSLSAAEDPAESVWKEDYCEWRCEVVKEECPIEDSYFYYRYRDFCPAEYFNGC